LTAKQDISNLSMLYTINFSQNEVLKSKLIFTQKGSILFKFTVKYLWKAFWEF